MASTHEFAAKLTWSGAAQGPTRSYDGYSRAFTAEIAGKPPLSGSAATAYRGDASVHNPEDLLVVALSSCHLLSYLALCARAGIAVLAYEDEAHGTMAIRDKRMRFTEVVLHPRVTLAAGSDLAKARLMHDMAHEQCFIANSVNFPVRHEAELILAAA